MHLDSYKNSIFPSQSLLSFADFHSPLEPIITFDSQNNLQKHYQKNKPIQFSPMLNFSQNTPRTSAEYQEYQPPNRTKSYLNTENVGIKFLQRNNETLVEVG